MRGAPGAPPVRTVFLGSGAFAVPVLERLLVHRSVEVVAVVSAPPRPAGRHGEVRPTPVVERATASSLATMTPTSLRDAGTVAELASLAPGLLVLADYGRLVPQAILDLPPNGALNLHPSLLPRHRGASPVPAAILAGDRETGVTLMLMDAGLDTGPLVAQARLPLRGDEIAPDLEAVLAGLAAALLGETLEDWLAGRRAALPQPEAGATLTRPLRRADGRLDPARAAVELERQVRAYQPWPGSYLEVGGQRLLVWRAEVAPPMVEEGEHRAAGTGARDLGVSGATGGTLETPGTLVASGADLALLTADGQLVLREVQPSGGRRMSAAELRRGRLRALPIRPDPGTAATSGEPG